MGENGKKKEMKGKKQERKGWRSTEEAENSGYIGRIEGVKNVPIFLNGFGKYS